MFLSDDAKRIIELLNQSSYKAYAVGGCVRDAIMNRKISDYDITTSALPNQVEIVLKNNGIKYVETGLKHGTITAVIDHKPYEITTFRTDGKYSDNRHPESVYFVTDIKDDLSRRDFTINAIAYNDKEGFVDLFGGIDDIDKKIIKTVGDSDKRFNEDALRIMRALRFSSQLGFSVEESTKNAIFKNKELLKNIANERIYSELIKLLLGDNCSEVLKEYIDVIYVIIPEIKDIYYDSLEFSPKTDYIRLAILLKNTENYEKVLKRLRVSKDIFDKVTKLIRFSDCSISDKIDIKTVLNKIGGDLFFDLIELKNVNDDDSDLITIKEETKRIIQNNEPYRIKDLKINGNDLMNIGYEGKEISEMLEFLLQEVIKNPNLNNKEELIRISLK
ncbi:MAG: CCA tRNA nucleotidyltransferase [Eubacterium sp.]|nr:CCA tRNA nucleotidyltransferase [Eubacterium sp.]